MKTYFGIEKFRNSFTFVLRDVFALYRGVTNSRTVGKTYYGREMFNRNNILGTSPKEAGIIMGGPVWLINK